MKPVIYELKHFLTKEVLYTAKLYNLSEEDSKTRKLNYAISHAVGNGIDFTKGKFVYTDFSGLDFRMTTLIDYPNKGLYMSYDGHMNLVYNAIKARSQECNIISKYNLG